MRRWWSPETWWYTWYQHSDRSSRVRASDKSMRRNTTRWRGRCALFWGWSCCPSEYEPWVVWCCAELSRRWRPLSSNHPRLDFYIIYIMLRHVVLWVSESWFCARFWVNLKTMVLCSSFVVVVVLLYTNNSSNSGDRNRTIPTVFSGRQFSASRPSAKTHTRARSPLVYTHDNTRLHSHFHARTHAAASVGSRARVWLAFTDKGNDWKGGEGSGERGRWWRLRTETEDQEQEGWIAHFIVKTYTHTHTHTHFIPY